MTKTMEIVGDPFNNMELLVKNLKTHENLLAFDVASAVQHYEKGEYEQFGEFMGQMVQVAAEGKRDDLFLY